MVEAYRVPGVICAAASSAALLLVVSDDGVEGALLLRGEARRYPTCNELPP